MWLIQLIESIGFRGVRPIEIFSNSEPAIKLTESDQINPRTKHIDIQLHWLKEHVIAGNFMLQYIQTSQQVADGLTKPATGRCCL